MILFSFERADNLGLHPDVAGARHCAVSVVVAPWTAAEGPLRTSTPELRLELLLADLIAPT